MFVCIELIGKLKTSRAEFWHVGIFMASIGQVPVWEKNHTIDEDDVFVLILKL